MAGEGWPLLVRSVIFSTEPLWAALFAVPPPSLTRPFVGAIQPFLFRVNAALAWRGVADS